MHETCNVVSWSIPGGIRKLHENMASFPTAEELALWMWQVVEAAGLLVSAGPKLTWKRPEAEHLQVQVWSWSQTCLAGGGEWRQEMDAGVAQRPVATSEAVV